MATARAAHMSIDEMVRRGKGDLKVVTRFGSVDRDHGDWGQVRRHVLDDLYDFVKLYIGIMLSHSCQHHIRWPLICLSKICCH